MQFIKRLFKKKEAPALKIELTHVGTIGWDEESEYWVGNYNGLKFSVAYDGLSHPEEELSSTVTKTLTNPKFPEEAMIKIRKLAKSQYSEERHKEIDRLEPQDIVFQSPNFILIQFFGPEDSEPFWFAEIHESEIYIGFDT